MIAYVSPADNDDGESFVGLFRSWDPSDDCCSRADTEAAAAATAAVLLLLRLLSSKDDGFQAGLVGLRMNECCSPTLSVHRMT